MAVRLSIGRAGAVRLWAAGLALSCGGEPSDSQTRPGALSSEGTSDFDPCYGTVERVSLELDDPRVAHYVEAVAGHHERTLVWEQYLKTASARGYTDHTRLMLDVEVTEGVESLFTPVPKLAGRADCTPSTSYGLQTIVSLATEDGALQGAFPLELRCRDDLDFATTQCSLPTGLVSLNMDGMTGTFELDVDPRFGPEPLGDIESEAHLWLLFRDGQVSGSFRPGLRWPEASVQVLPFRWAPVEATFPGKDCGGDLVFYEDVPEQ